MISLEFEMYSRSNLTEGLLEGQHNALISNPLFVYVFGRKYEILMSKTVSIDTFSHNIV